MRKIWQGRKEEGIGIRKEFSLNFENHIRVKITYEKVTTPASGVMGPTRCGEGEEVGYQM